MRTFGKEFVVMKIDIEIQQGIWYKLHIMVLPIDDVYTSSGTLCL